MIRSLLLISLIFYNFGYGICGDCDPSSRPRVAESELREKLFCNYNKNIRPVKHYSNQTNIKIELYPIKVWMNEREEKITIIGNVQYLWTDYFLQWEPSEYEDIQYLGVSSDEIWMPSIVIDSPADDQKLQSSKVDCLVSYIGKIICFPVHTISAYCTPDLLKYPFDQQNCVILFMAPTYSGVHVDLEVFDAGVTLALYNPNRAWEIVEVTLKRESTNGLSSNATFYPYLRCSIILQRHFASQSSIIVLPGLVLASITLLTYFMGELYTVRLSVSGLSLICNVMYCLYFGLNLPPNGNQTPLIVTFFRDSVLICGITIIASTLLQRLRNINSHPSNWLSNFIGKLGTSPFGKVFFIFTESHSEDDDAAEIIQDTKKKPSVWSQLATIIDRLLFFICLFIYIVLFLFFLP